MLTHNTTRASYPDRVAPTHRTGALRSFFVLVTKQLFAKAERRPVDLDTHVDPGRLLGLHDAMLGRDRDDERSLSSTRVRCCVTPSVLRRFRNRS
jgi:hypothetical protein